MRLVLLTSCVLLLVGSSASAQVRDQGIIDREIRDKNIRDKGIRDEGIRDDSVRDQGRIPSKVTPSPQGPVYPVQNPGGFYLNVAPGYGPPEFPGYAHVQVTTSCYSQTVYTHRPRCCIPFFNFRSCFGGRCW